MSTAMVSRYLLDRFDLPEDTFVVRRHEPEDFVVRFSRREDRDRILAAPPSGGLLPLIWHPWWRTASHSGVSFRCLVLVGLRGLPLHAQSAAVAQSILGPAYAAVVEVLPRPADDDREFFVKAWCRHPRFIPDEEIIFISEPRVYAGSMLGLRPEDIVHRDLPGQHYLVRLRIVEFQD